MAPGPVGADGVIVGVLAGPQVSLASLASQGNGKALQKRVQGVVRSFDKWFGKLTTPLRMTPFDRLTAQLRAGHCATHEGKGIEPLQRRLDAGDIIPAEHRGDRTGGEPGRGKGAQGTEELLVLPIQWFVAEGKCQRDIVLGLSGGRQRQRGEPIGGGVQMVQHLGRRPATVSHAPPGEVERQREVAQARGEFTTRSFDKLRMTSFDKLRVTSFDKLRVTAFDRLRARSFDRLRMTSFGGLRVTAFDRLRMTSFGGLSVRSFDRLTMLLIRPRQAIQQRERLVLAHHVDLKQPPGPLQRGEGPAAGEEDDRARHAGQERIQFVAREVIGAVKDKQAALIPQNRAGQPCQGRHVVADLGSVLPIAVESHDATQCATDAGFGLHVDPDEATGEAVAPQVGGVERQRRLADASHPH